MSDRNDNPKIKQCKMKHQTKTNRHPMSHNNRKVLRGIPPLLTLDMHKVTRGPFDPERMDGTIYTK